MPRLSSDELIDDRALKDAAGDRFRHADFAAELADLVTTVQAPANIALFAPWGSGKSGLANLLENELSNKPGWGKKLRFARFDAFKYAEAPLRRNFIAEMARQLNVSSDEYSSGLYRNTTTSDLSFDKTQVQRLVSAFALSLVIVLAMTLGLLALVAIASKGPTAENLNGLMGKYIVGALPLAALITGFVGLATKGLTVTATRAAPSTEEEFEERFCNLLKKANADRVVIFVDELDRCAANEVASTLETIKTFLEVSGCVFIVAADHQVLEQALRKQVRQQTPHDPSNPYYSAGSSYLDKVFQFQLSLPQLKPRRLTSFALDLVRGRNGIWQRIDHIDDVISVLMPTHITSPRRVKVLLNSFAITYRLAERRVEQGVLREGLNERASEVARLVCLRCEFPLFADDLHNDVRLLDILQRFGAADRDEEDFNEFLATFQVDGRYPPMLVDRAVAYYRGHRPVAELIAGADEDQNDDDDQTRAVQQAHIQQLMRYLLKTAYVGGPYSDLVHLESSGVGLSLAPADAQELERAAIDNDARAVEQVVRRLDTDQRPDALRLLAHEVREALPGLEGDNVTAMLLWAVARFADDAEPIADTLIAAVNQHQRAAALRPESYAGALLLARARGGTDGEHLCDQVLAQPDALDSADVRLQILIGAEHLTDGQQETIGEAMARTLLTDKPAFAETLESLSQHATVRALRQAEAPLVDAVTEDYEARAALEDEDANLEEDARADLQARLYEVPPLSRLEHHLDALLERERHVEAEELARVLLTLNRMEARNVVDARLPRMGTVENAELPLALIKAAARREADAWPRWLSAIPNEREYSEVEIVALSQLVDRLWQLLDGDAPPNDDDSGAALTALQQTQTPLGGSVVASLASKYGTSATSAAGFAAQARAFAQAWRFADAGLLDAEALGDVVVEAYADTLRTELAATPAGTYAVRQMAAAAEEVQRAAKTHVVAALPRALAVASTSRVHDLTRVLEDRPPWLSARDHETLQLRAALRAAALGDDSPTPQWIAARAEEWSHHIADLIGQWLGLANPKPDDAWPALAHLSNRPPTGTFADALRTYAEGLGAEGRRALLAPVLSEPLDWNADQDFLRAAGFPDIDSRRVVPLLVAGYQKATNDDQRRRVLKAWQAYAPTTDVPRRQLIEGIWLPLAQGGAQSLRTALEHFDLVSPAPRGMQRDIVRRLRAIKIENKDLDKLRDRRLLNAGWIKKQKLGRRAETPERK